MTKLLKGAAAVLCLILMTGMACAWPPLRPNTGKELYNPPWGAEFDRLAANCRASGRVDCDALSRLMKQPHAYWMGFDTIRQDLQNLHGIIRDARMAGRVPTIVLYSLPDRDCGGGVRTKNKVTVGDYQQWIAMIANSVNYYQNTPINIIIEPGALANVVTRTDELCGMRRKSEILAERTSLIHYTLWNFLQQDIKKNRFNPNVRLFLDVGGPDLLSDPKATLAMARAIDTILRGADIDGISVNVSGRASFTESVAWGRKLIDLLHSYIKGRMTIAVDTSRAGSWGEKGCNAPGTALGQETPTLDHADQRVELAMIIQNPGTSDGDGEGCNGNTPAGEFDISILSGYLRNSAQKQARR